MEPSQCGCHNIFATRNLGSNWSESNNATLPDNLGTLTEYSISIGSASQGEYSVVSGPCTCCNSTNILILSRNATVVSTKTKTQLDQTNIAGIRVVEHRKGGTKTNITVDTNKFDISNCTTYTNGTETAIFISIAARTAATTERPSGSTTATAHLAEPTPPPSSNRLEVITTWFKTYQAVIAIVVVSVLSTLISPLDSMDTFMGMYMTLFAFLQLCDINITATRLGRYDILAKNFKIMGYLMPVINLLLGIWHFNGVPSILKSSITGAFSAAKSIGPFNAMFAKEQVDCGCVGSTGNMKVGLITFLEELLMAVLCAMQLNTLMNNHPEAGA